MSETNQKINWYPGHMAKTKRQLQEQLSRADLVIELCDARLPRASRNPDLIRLMRDKEHILILQKSDLADEQETEKWVAYFRSLQITCSAIDVNRQYKQVLRLITAGAEKKVAQARKRGISKTVRAMVVGVPNVGKSTLINRLNGSAVARVGDRPGVTRSTQWIRINPYLELMDSPGMLWPRLDDQLAALRLSYIAAIRDDVQDVCALAVHLLDDMMEMKPEAVMTRFKVADSALRGAQLMEAVCRGRGFLLKGNEIDEERGSRVVLDEFRAGKLGRVTLEKAPVPYPRKETVHEDQPTGTAEHADSD